ncbi:MAG: MBL fold metallo-hydrolase [Candidatus Marinimicrobia bacterium]|nr:MBL fold metallo-hydrolase [Candidatus Neomarinimicrobiota bacterium]
MKFTAPVIIGLAAVLAYLGPPAELGMMNSPDADQPAHHTDSGFTNPWAGEQHSARFRDVLKFMWEHPPGRPRYKTSVGTIPVTEPNWEAIESPGDSMVITWLGHATFLIQIGGKNILTDPNLSDRASPVSWAGPRRVTRPGMTVEQLPRIDAVLISHNHYDHLDTRTVKQIGSGPTWYAPLGMQKWFRARGISKVVELDWWQSDGTLGNIKILATPSKHFSGRTPWDRDKALWSSWVVAYQGRKIYFAGDTGYGPHFKEIGVSEGPIDVALLPIGAYEPRWFMSPVHIDPAEAIQAQAELQAQRSVAMHWGTFLLTNEPLQEPPEMFRQYADSAGLDEGHAIILRPGETLIVPRETTPVP